MKPYGIISDTHHHNWHAFSTVLPSGINSRLNDILEEFKRVAHEVVAQGGDTIYHCGDLFHVRGSIAPSVLNPTLDTYKFVMDNLGIKIRILAGNHDLESKNSERLSSAITALEGIGCKVVNEPTMFDDDKVIMIAWIQNVDVLKEEILKIKDKIGNVKEWTLMLHAPVDGVISGLPSHGLDNEWLAKLGFSKVFSGHYHNHKNFDDCVYSVGALTHQTWSDIGSKAGFIINNGSEVKFYESKTPKFVELTSENKDDLPQLVKGNYVRTTINTGKKSDIEKVRELIQNNGALGVTVISSKSEIIVSRSDSSVMAGASIEQSVSDFIDKGFADFEQKAELSAMCADILTAVRENA